MQLSLRNHARLFDQNENLELRLRKNKNLTNQSKMKLGNKNLNYPPLAPKQNPYWEESNSG